MVFGSQESHPNKNGWTKLTTRLGFLNIQAQWTICLNYNISNPSNFWFLQAVDIEATHAGMCNSHYKHQLWEQESPKNMLFDEVEKLSVNEHAYNRIHVNADGRPLNYSQQISLKKCGKWKTGIIICRFYHRNVETQMVDCSFKKWVSSWQKT